MKRVSAYQTSDGQTFTDKAQAKAHEKNLNIINGIAAVAGKLDGDMDFYNDDLGHAALASANELTTFIAKYADELRDVLSGKAINTKDTPEA